MRRNETPFIECISERFPISHNACDIRWVLRDLACCGSLCLAKIGRKESAIQSMTMRERKRIMTLQERGYPNVPLKLSMYSFSQGLAFRIYSEFIDLPVPAFAF